MMNFTIFISCPFIFIYFNVAQKHYIFVTC